MQAFIKTVGSLPLLLEREPNGSVNEEENRQKTFNLFDESDGFATPAHARTLCRMLFCRCTAEQIIKGTLEGFYKRVDVIRKGSSRDPR